MNYPKISFYENIRQTKSNETIDIDLFIEATKIGKWMNDIIEVRSGARAKNTLPAVTISGVFTERKASKLDKHSGYIIIDIDHVKDIEAVKDTLSGDRFVVAVWKSASGNGLAVLFKIDPRRHLKAFQGLEEYFFTQYELTIDPSGKDVSRARFVSFDPDTYSNWGAEKFTIYQKEKPKALYKLPKTIFVQSDFEDIINQIETRNIDIVDEYQYWLACGFIFADKFGDGGRSYFHRISRPGMKYNDRICDKQFEHCLRHKGQGYTDATFYWLAKQAGIQIMSEKTKTIAIAASHALKGGRNIKDTAKLLKDREEIPFEVSEPIIQQVFENNIDVDVEDSIIHQMEAWLNLNYEVRRNTITRKLEDGKKILEDRDYNTIYMNGKKELPKDLNFEIFNRLLNSDFTPDYNPLVDWFEANKERQTSGNIDKLINTIITKQPRPYVELFIKKWLVSVVQTIYTVPTPLMLVMVGEKQNTGKTTWFRKLLPKELQIYYAESKLDKGKDDEILMTQKLIIMDDEMSGKSKRNSQLMKDLTSKQVFTLREPYGRGNVDLKRLAILCGTTNDTGIINDPTGNRRILPIHILDIDKTLYNSIDKTELWIEVLNLWRDGFNPDLNADDIDFLASHTSDFQEVSIEKELIQTFFEPAGVDGRFLSTTDIKVILEKNSQQKLQLNRLGQELRNLGFVSVVKWEDNKSKRGYWTKEAGKKEDEFPF